MPTKVCKTHFYADECIPLPVVTSLKISGINIIHVYDKDFVSKSDDFHFKQSKKLERVLITLDKDYYKYTKFQLNNHPGILLLHVGTVTPKSIERLLRKILKYLTPNFMNESRVVGSMSSLKKEKNQKTETFVVK